jgi:hypothetical protein
MILNLLYHYNPIFRPFLDVARAKALGLPVCFNQRTPTTIWIIQELFEQTRTKGGLIMNGLTVRLRGAFDR